MSHRFLRPLSIMTRPPSWKACAPFPPAGNLTYAQQESLPTLPVPALQSTLQKLKASLKPLEKTEEEYNAALKKIDAFAAGAGPTLQQRLEARAAEAGREHWLEEWWDNLAYLGYRDSVSLMAPSLLRILPLSLSIGRS
jgi:carnitine O-acetyltransferase